MGELISEAFKHLIIWLIKFFIFLLHSSWGRTILLTVLLLGLAFFISKQMVKDKIVRQNLSIEQSEVEYEKLNNGFLNLALITAFALIALYVLSNL